jgi:hypothetical protein
MARKQLDPSIDRAARLRRQKREHMRRKRLIEWQRAKGRRAGNIRIGWWIYTT